jgi:hypothetical protein
MDEDRSSPLVFVHWMDHTTFQIMFGPNHLAMFTTPEKIVDYLERSQTFLT